MLLKGGASGEFAFQTKLIAELFPETTVMICDLSGFTAWSSTRQPEQVFMLLETLYHSYDVAAEKRKVFKVETVGDSYVAVCGLPEACPDHAVVMARFARDCLKQTDLVLNRLETELGPDTGDLAMRFGLHSGPVTAGVLRGDKSRFQLFGDTVNTASRMESTGAPGKIHLSEATATILIKEGKSSWLTKRDSPIAVKGKGEMTSYWLSKDIDTENVSASFTKSSSSIGKGHTLPPSGRAPSKKTKKLVQWTAEVLGRELKQIIARRGDKKDVKRFEWSVKCGETVFDEVQEILALPGFNSGRGVHHSYVKPVNLSPVVQQQLSHFVTELALRYHDNPFHSFEHASHVTMSVSKLLS